jgi:hypothetical protein
VHFVFLLVDWIDLHLERSIGNSFSGCGNSGKQWQFVHVFVVGFFLFFFFFFSSLIVSHCVLQQSEYNKCEWNGFKWNELLFVCFGRRSVEECVDCIGRDVDVRSKRRKKKKKKKRKTEGVDLFVCFQDVWWWNVFLGVDGVVL